MNPITSTASTAQSFRQWRHGDSLPEALGRAESDVRAKPTDVPARWLLFELLCVMGDWERALKQLQRCATFDPSLDGPAQALRGLIRAEHQREEVFAGRQMPVPVVALPDWMAKLAQALACHAQQDDAAADVLRQAALDEAPATAGGSHLGAFEWITDTDTRLGPVCEVVASGAYRWVAFADLKSITVEAPSRLVDLVWVQAQLVLHDGTPLRGYIPSRYPGTQHRHDALRLARETTWRDVGKTGVFAHGQKTWMTDQGDCPIFDIRHCEFGLASPHLPAAEAP